MFADGYLRKGSRNKYDKSIYGNYSQFEKQFYKFEVKQMNELGFKVKLTQLLLFNEHSKIKSNLSNFEKRILNHNLMIFTHTFKN